MTQEELLAEIEDILRTMPPRETLTHDIDANYAWLGRVSAAIEAWSYPKMVPLASALADLHNMFGFPRHDSAIAKILILLHQARHDLRMKTVGPVNVAVGAGRVFEYFDECRKLIEVAKQDLFFVDPYLDAEFVSRYLPQAAQGVTIRLLASKHVATLVPAADAFARQSGNVVQVRSANGFHDRHMIVDRTACYQSGASFKDGAKKASTTLTQIVDIFPQLLQTYEGIWANGKVER